MKIKAMIMTGIATLGLGVGVLATPVYADDAPTTQGSVTCPEGSLKETANTLAECNLTGENDLMETILQIIQVVIGVLGIVTVAIIILGGIQYVTSVGDSQKVKKAKDTILYGVIGLVIAILAFAIVNFVASSLTKESTPPSNDNNGGNNSTVR